MTVRVQLNDGTTQDVDERSAAELLQRGEVAAVNAGARIPVIRNDGQIVDIDAQDAPGAVSAGWQVLNQDEAQRAELQRDYGGAAGMATAAVSQIGLGVPAAVAGAIDEDAAKYIRKAEAANPGSAAAGMIGDIVLTELLSGSLATGVNAGRAARLAGMAGRGLTAPTRLMLGAGAIAERAAGRGLAGALARGAVEGGIYSSVHAAREAALGDPEMTAERILSEGAYGAAAGAALSGIFHGAGRAATAGIEKIGPRVAEYADDLATRKAIQSLGGNQTMIKRLGKRGDEFVRDMARTVREDLPEAVGKRSGSSLDPSEMYDAAAAHMNSVAKQFAAVEQEIRSAGIRPNEARIFSAMDDVASKLEANPVTRAQGKAIRASIDNIRTDAQAEARDFGWWRQVKTALNNERLSAIRQGNMTDPVIQLATSVRGALREAADEAADTVSKTLGKDIGSAWRDVNRRYGIAEEIKDMAEHGKARQWSNRTLGMSEQQGLIAGMAGAAQSGLAGALTVGGLMSLAQRVIKTYGDQWTSSAANAIARAGGDVNAAIRQLGEKSSVRIATSAARALGVPMQAASAARAVVSMNKESDEQRYRHAIVASLALSQPGAAQEYVAQIAPQIAATDPSVAEAMASRIQAGANLVLTKAQMSGGRAIKQSLPKPTADKRRAVLDTFDVLTGGPSVAIDAARSGRLSRSHIEAMDLVHPKTSSEARTAMSEMIASRDVPLRSRDQIRRLIGTPLTDADRPDVSARVQLALQIKINPPRMAAMPRSDAAKESATRYDRMES